MLMTTPTTGGEDTLHVSLYVEWDNSLFACYCQDFDGAQRQEKENTKQEEEQEGEAFPHGVEIGGYNYYVAPHGARRGDDTSCYFHYVLKRNDITFLLSERDLKDEKSPPNARVEIGSKPLMAWGLPACWRMVRDFFKEIGGKIMRNGISRVDFCADLPGVDVHPFQNAISRDSFVTRAKAVSLWEDHGDTDEDTCKTSKHLRGKRKSGVTIGKDKILCRIYDKVLEVQKDPDKQMILEQNRWGGKPQEKAVRVEFQIRREALTKFHHDRKPLDISSVEDWQKDKYFVVMACCRKWLRIYKHKFDRTHTARLNASDLLPGWVKAIAAFEAWSNPDRPNDEHTAQEIAKKTTRETKPLEAAPFKLVEGAIGCVVSAMIRSGETFNRENYIRKVKTFTSMAFAEVMSAKGWMTFARKEIEKTNRLNASVLDDTYFAAVIKRMANCGVRVTTHAPQSALSGACSAHRSTRARQSWGELPVPIHS